MNLSLFPEDLIQVQPVIDYSVRALCLKPYPDHKKGCPNFGEPKHAHRCPPDAPLFDQAYDISVPVYAVVGRFDVAAFAARMKELHPEWSERQCRNSRRWQGSAKKLARDKAKAALKDPRCVGYAIVECPEGAGVDVTETMKRVGIILWPFIDIDQPVFFLTKPRGKA